MICVYCEIEWFLYHYLKIKIPAKVDKMMHRIFCGLEV